ncbi:hypothetical protein ACOSP7_003090 [Xanthoceras sorbifolium]
MPGWPVSLREEITRGSNINNSLEDKKGMQENSVEVISGVNLDGLCFHFQRV